MVIVLGSVCFFIAVFSIIFAFSPHDLAPLNMMFNYIYGRIFPKSVPPMFTQVSIISVAFGNQNSWIARFIFPWQMEIEFRFPLWQGNKSQSATHWHRIGWIVFAGNSPPVWTKLRSVRITAVFPKSYGLASGWPPYTNFFLFFDISV